jgi:hypothetical protein
MIKFQPENSLVIALEITVPKKCLRSDLDELLGFVKSCPQIKYNIKDKNSLLIYLCGEARSILPLLFIGYDTNFSCRIMPYRFEINAIELMKHSIESSILEIMRNLNQTKD